MQKIQKKDYLRYSDLFHTYRYNLPVIYSSLEGQYDGELYVNNYENPDYTILFTPFDFHYVAGNPDTPYAPETLNHLIFEDYILTKYKEEAVVFCPSGQWQDVISSVFNRHSGVYDVRKIFTLNTNHFMDKGKNITIPEDVTVRILYEQDFHSACPYPVARVYKNGICVSFCSGFMLGKKHAEIDISTVESEQNKGYGKIAAAALITELLKRDIIPDWCTWPYREVSQILAKKLGFESQPDVTANIWLKQNEHEHNT